MSKAKRVSLRECFVELQDPRREHNRLHNLWDIIALTICAVVCGADSWVEVEEYGDAKLDWLQTFLELPNGIPSHDTIGRVFSRLDPVGFQEGFGRWVSALAEAADGRVVNIDGKTLCNSGDAAAGQAALHLVSAWANANELVLGQVAVADKSNEITAIPELLGLLDLHGAIVTIDAMGCQKEIARQIVERGGDYVLTVKENQPTLYDDIDRLFSWDLPKGTLDVERRRHRTKGRGHGRHEERFYQVVEAPAELLERHPEWKGLRTVGMVFSVRQVGDRQPTAETRYFISTLPPKAKQFAAAVRGHWGIENGLHWVLDVVFREDQSRVRKDHAPENLGLLRRLAASLVKNKKKLKGGVSCKRKQAGWNNDVLLQILGENLKR